MQSSAQDQRQGAAPTPLVSPLKPEQAQPPDRNWMIGMKTSWFLVLGPGAGSWCWVLVLVPGAGSWCWRSCASFSPGRLLTDAHSCLRPK